MNELRKPNYESEPMRFEHEGKVLLCYHIGRAGEKEIYEVKGGGYLVLEDGAITTGSEIDGAGNIVTKKGGKKK